jgi:D-inositol-3-phosphate glycosyltransferase
MRQLTRIALVSEHASPLALLGGEDAGGQNVYVDELSRSLGAMGNLAAGPPEFLPKDRLWALMPAFQRAFLRFMLRSGARYDLLHGNFWMSGWVVTRLSRQLDIPAVQLFHANGMTKRRHQGGADTSPDERIAVEREVVAGVDRVIAQCPAEYSELIEDYDADPGRIALIPAAVNAQRFRPVPRAEARRAIGLEGEGPVVVYVGRMLPRKDVRNALHAVALLAREGRSPVRLLLVGGDSAPDSLASKEVDHLRGLAHELGIAERVIFAGQQQPDSLRLYYGAGDIAVTTPWYEPFGLTPLEAMACGRPVVGSAVGGLTFTIQDGVTGALVPPRDPAALADKLAELLANPELLARMGVAARARVEREFTWAMTARRTALLYETLLGERMGSAPVRERAVGADHE